MPNTSNDTKKDCGELGCLNDSQARPLYSGLKGFPPTLIQVGSNETLLTVIGSTVNAASPLEALTRALDCALVASDDLVRLQQQDCSCSVGLLRENGALLSVTAAGERLRTGLRGLPMVAT